MRTLMLIALFVGLFGCNAFASELVRLTVPPGFEGPVVESPAPEVHIKGYVRKIPGQERGTLLQVMTYEMGSKLAGIPKEQLGNSSEFYLMHFLSGVERRRTSYHASKPTRVTLGGLPAARVEWKGVMEGFQTSGVMYCVIVGTVVITFHTQGFEDSLPTDRTEALKAIESVTFARS